MDGPLRQLSDVELEKLARVAPADIDHAGQFWEWAASPKFRALPDATPEVTPLEFPRE